jgi:hypothetical protein
MAFKTVPEVGIAVAVSSHWMGSLSRELGNGTKAAGIKESIISLQPV